MYTKGYKSGYFEIAGDVQSLVAQAKNICKSDLEKAEYLISSAKNKTKLYKSLLEDRGNLTTKKMAEGIMKYVERAEKQLFGGKNDSK